MKGWIDVTSASGGAARCVQVSQIRFVSQERADKACIVLGIPGCPPVSVAETYAKVLALIEEAQA